MGLAGLLAAVFAFYGMGTANKGVLGGAWVVVGDLTTFATNVTTQVDKLVASVGSVGTAVGDFQGVVRDNLDVQGFRTNLTVGAGSCEGRGAGDGGRGLVRDGEGEGGEAETKGGKERRGVSSAFG